MVTQIIYFHSFKIIINQIYKIAETQRQIQQVYSKQKSMKSTLGNGSFFKEQKPIIQGHILKFIQRGKSPKEKGKICFPEQTYGISQESPDQFKMRNTLVPKNGYRYQHQHKPQFKYYSQKRYFSIDGSLDPSLSQQIHFQDSQNKVKFHRKKGRLSQFLDKNAWMNKTTKIMGFERDQRARQFSNRDRSLKISQIKVKDKYNNPSAIEPKTTTQYFRTLATLTSQKMRIRQKRNQVAERYSRHIQNRQAHSSSFRRESPIDRQQVQNRMLKTARDWSPSKVAKSNYNESSRTMNMNRMLKFYNTKIDKRTFQQESEIQNQSEKLQKWYRTTCSSKWVYNTKIQTDQDQLQC